MWEVRRPAYAPFLAWRLAPSLSKDAGAALQVADGSPPGMTSVFSGRLVFPDGRIEDEFLDRRCSATADVSTLIHVLYGVGWALAGLRLYTSLARSQCRRCPRP